MSDDDKQPCLDFIKKYPGDYQTEELKKDSEIYLYNKSNTIFFLDEDSVLPYPITIVSSNQIALFGVKKSDGKKPKLTISEQPEDVPESIKLKGIREIYKYRLTHPSYYGQEIIGSIDQCESCLISGFSVDRDVQDYNEKIKKIFTVKGSKSIVHLNDIEAKGDTHTETGYFMAENILSLTISNFYASSEDNNKLKEPAITIKNTPEIKLENISISEIDIEDFYNPSEPKKIISLINPVDFTVLNADIAASSYGQPTNPVYIGLSISFESPEKYIKKRVNGVIEQFDFSGFGLITDRAEGIRFDGTPGLWAGLLIEAYRQVKGLVTIKDLTVEDGSSKTNIINLPNLQIKGLNVQSTSVSRVNNVMSTLPVLLTPILSRAYPSISHTRSHSLMVVTPAATIQVNATQTVTPSPVDRGAENMKVCNRLVKSDRRLCLKFLEKNSADFEVKSLADNTSISIVNQSNKLFLIIGTQNLSHLNSYHKCITSVTRGLFQNL
ncbi:hypothetical protein NX722_18515 [Endozoicomonas gorgoniicola]|uniref:Uncharacterized protein n=1 Tax=Endozoicomonas gorgoniicola TaxID=1234144 RepID=A0ABT3MYY2_9GAMM|nr:hypothetical protein [Endozoicomonas gorgoniicola]MCW7554574.1 hypothetical protein [Endozoicomonas gorgoniicola]